MLTNETVWMVGKLGIWGPQWPSYVTRSVINIILVLMCTSGTDCGGGGEPGFIHGAPVVQGWKITKLEYY